MSQVILKRIKKKPNKIFTVVLHIISLTFFFCFLMKDCFANSQDCPVNKKNDYENSEECSGNSANCIIDHQNFFENIKYHSLKHKTHTTELDAEEDPCFKPYGISFGLGYGLRDIVPLRIGFQKDFGKRWISECTWKVGGYWEGSYYYLKTRRNNIAPSNRSLHAIAGAAVFRFQRETCLIDSVFPYFELGIGFAYLSKKEIAGRQLGLHLEFEDRAGMGIRFGSEGQYDLSYRFLHFSNACLGPRNNGINLHAIVLGYWF